MNPIQIAVAGIAGAALMSILMTIIHRSRWANADMVRAVGSLATRSYDNALLPGLVIHSLSGVLFAFPYAVILGLVDVGSATALALIGALIGFVHGFAMSFVLLTVVSERHPLERFREAGIEVAVAHVVGHIGYGAAFGAVLGLFVQ